MYLCHDTFCVRSALTLAIQFRRDSKVPRNCSLQKQKESCRNGWTCPRCVYEEGDIERNCFHVIGNALLRLGAGLETRSYSHVNADHIEVARSSRLVQMLKFVKHTTAAWSHRETRGHRCTFCDRSIWSVGCFVTPINLVDRFSIVTRVVVSSFVTLCCTGEWRIFC